ncbi:MAG: nucleoside phosphorylase [Chitinophagales bacterium]
MKRIAESELILNPDGSIYHLHLLPEDLADKIITVGDPDRVHTVTKHFDSIEVKKQKREFCTHTGYIGKKRVSVISTGIGTDNIDIVFNELDALVNIDLQTRTEKTEKKSLEIIRIGTSGTLQKDINVDSVLLSSHGLGLEGLLNFYRIENDESEQAILDKINQSLTLPIAPRISEASDKLLAHFDTTNYHKGITATSTGFYGPQGRFLRLQPAVDDYIDKLAAIDLGGNRITNLEMETAGIYGLGKLLGHQCLSINVILANRPLGLFSKTPKESVEKVIIESLEKIETL